MVGANLVGFGLAPLAPATLTDYLFHDGKLGLSVAIVATGPLGALLIWLGVPPDADGAPTAVPPAGDLPADERI